MYLKTTGLRSCDLVKQKPKKKPASASQQRRPAGAPASSVPAARHTADHQQQQQQHAHVTANHQQQQQQQQQLQVTTNILSTLGNRHVSDTGYMSVMHVQLLYTCRTFCPLWGDMSTCRQCGRAVSLMFISAIIYVGSRVAYITKTIESQWHISNICGSF